MRGVAVLLFGLTAWAVADDDPVELLMKVRERVMAHAQQIPNHICTETITRDVYEYLAGGSPKSCDALLGRRKLAGPATLTRLASTDRLRLDVALADSQEIYSWAGAEKFEDREVDEFIPPGAIGTGPFASELLGVFEIRDPKFIFEGDTVVNGRRLMEYSFTVPKEQSHYKAKAGNQRLITGYTGTMLVDPATADLAQLTIRTEELPAASHLCEVDSTLEYGTVRLQGEDYLVPGSTRQRFIQQDGSEAENTVTFNACREFRGASTLSFGGVSETAAGKPQTPATLTLPAGLPVTVDLTSTIQVDQAAAGDRIEGRLAAPIRDAKHGLLAPDGAAVEGRLMRVETAYGRPNQVTIALRWETLEVNGVQQPLSITPDRQVGNARASTPGQLARRPEGFELPRPGELRYAVYHFSGEHGGKNSARVTLVYFRAMESYAAILAWSIAVAAAAENDPAEVLKRVTAKVLAREAALPNYTCVETVTRDYYQYASATPPRSCSAPIAQQKSSTTGLPHLWTMTDRLRLDVTINRRGEIYSWVGATKFEDGSIDKVVKQGPIGTGSFGALLAVIFKQDAKTFHFSKYLLDQGRSLMEYSFEVSQEDSNYNVKAGDSWVNTAYSGTFQADPETDEVARITMQTAELSPATDSCQTKTKMEFGLTRIGDGEFLLPKGAWRRFLTRDGNTAENVMALSACREYRGESTVSFSPAPELGGGNGRKMTPSQTQLPAGLPFTIELTMPISTDTAAAGDPFAARLVSALRDKNGKTLAPAHAAVAGRLVQVEMRHIAPPGAVLVLKPITVEIGGVATPLTASRKVAPVAKGRQPIQLPLLWEQDAGIFPLPGEHAVMKAGFRSDWQTVAGDAGPGSK